MKIIISALIAISFSTAVHAQTGINTTTPGASSILEINSDSKGVLFPRLNIDNVQNQAPVVASPMTDGLLAYNNGTVNRQSLYFWDAALNAGAGSWSRLLYFKETPKVATIGFIADHSVLDNAIGGGEEFVVSQATNNYKIISSGYMPGLGFRHGSSWNTWSIEVGPGTYTMEISYLLSAPPPNPASNGTPFQGNYYNMGYFTDMAITAFDSNTGISGSTFFIGRVEGSTMSPISTQHRMRFLLSFSTAGVGNVFDLTLYIGRRSGSTLNDMVNILANGSIIKLTKLQ